MNNLIGVALITVAVLALLVLFLRGQGSDLVPDSDNCPVDGSYAAQVAILVDPSDSLTSVQELVARRILETIRAEVPATAEIRIFTLGQAGRGDTASVLRRCVPVHPDSASAFTDALREVRRRYDDFERTLSDTLSTLLDARGDDVSPLLQGIQVAAVSTFQPRRSTIPRKLMIVSDMLQHSAVISFYPPGLPDFGVLMRNPDYGTLRVDLSGVEVLAFFLARAGDAGRIQASGVREFWEEYFVDQGAHAAARPTWINVEG